MRRDTDYFSRKMNVFLKNKQNSGSKNFFKWQPLRKFQWFFQNFSPRRILILGYFESLGVWKVFFLEEDFLFKFIWPWCDIYKKYVTISREFIGVQAHTNA